MKSYGQRMCRRLIGIAALSLLNLSPIDAEGPTLARLSFWVPPKRMEEFAKAYEERVVPILEKHGLVESSQRGRATLDSVFSRLFEVTNPSALTAAEEALRNDPECQETLQRLDAAFHLTRDDSPVPYHLRPYQTPAGPGQAVEAGPGFRQGLWTNFGLQDNLISSPFPIYAILQDQAGDLWFGSWGGGICRYDGAEFVTFGENDGLADLAMYVLALFEDREGNLWIGTHGTGVIRYDGMWVSFFTRADGLANDKVNAILEDDQGNLWFGTDRGLSRYNGERFSSLTTLDGLVDNVVLSMLEDSEGNLWIGTDGGVSRYDGKVFTNFTVAHGLPDAVVASIFEDKEGHFWFGTRSGLTRFNGKSFTTLTHDDGLEIGQVNAITQDQEGSLWIGTRGGINRYDGKEFKIFTTADGLANNNVQSILEDREGHLWFGLARGGISRNEGLRLTPFTAADGLPSSFAFDVLEDRQGNLWIAHRSGLSRYDRREFVHFTVEDGLADETVYSILEDRDGDLWLGTPRGVSRFDGKDFTTFTVEEGAPSFGGSADIIQDRHGNLWFCWGWTETESAGGVTRFDGENFFTFTTENGLANNRVRAVIEDREGYLWLGTGGGLQRYDGESFTTFTPEDGLARWFVDAILEDRQGDLWFGLGFLLGDVQRYDGKMFTTFTAEDGLTPYLIVSILEDQRGHLWFGSWGGGVSRFDGQVFQSFNRKDGLPDDAVQDILQDRKGNIWIATEGGVIRYRPSRTPPAIHIKQVIADRLYEPSEKVALPSTQQFVVVEVQGRSLSSRPDQMVYLYRLRGYDDEWRQTRTRRIEYTNLPVGQYEFQVKAVDRDLNYSEEPATVSIEVYYQPISSSIRISELNIQDIFASFYKTYAEKPIGSVLITNDDPTQIEGTLSFFIPDLMRRPTEKTILLEPQSSQIISLHAFLDEELLDLEGATPAQAEVFLSCEIGEQTFSIQESANITIYGRGALTWDDLVRAAAFVTPEDHSVSVFSRSLFEEYRSHIKRQAIDGNIPTAMLLFEALNAHGIKYTKDASTPYSQVRGDQSAVDNIQYPSELLRSKMGDCDDCTVLYCALLENLDIPTALIDHPNHILMMFDSGITEDRYFGFSLDEDRYVERDGRFWIPIEVTKLGEGSFMEAWELGAKTCQRLGNMDELVTDVRKVWPEYPYALPIVEGDIQPPDSEELERAFIDDMEQLKMIREGFVERQYLRPLLEDPINYQRRMELAHTLIQSGDFNNAISTLMHLLDTDFKTEAYYFIGYSYAGKMDFEAAIQYIKKALEHDPENRGYKRSLEVLKGELAQ